MRLPDSVAAALAAGRPALGCWSVTGSASVLRAMGEAGLDLLAIDAQHSPVGVTEVAALLRARPERRLATMVRVPANDAADIGRVADAGADLIVVPMIRSAAEAADAVRATRYPPHGGRSFGPFGFDLAGLEPADVEARVGILAMIETAEALETVDEICAVPGLAGVYVGPADLSLALGLPPMRAFDTDQVHEPLRRIAAAATAHGVLAGVHSRSGAERELGYGLITIGNELSMMTSAIRQLTYR